MADPLARIPAAVAATRIGIGHASIYRAFKLGLIPHSKTGKRYYVPQYAVTELKRRFDAVKKKSPAGTTRLPALAISAGVDWDSVAPKALSGDSVSEWLDRKLAVQPELPPSNGEKRSTLPKVLRDRFQRDEPLNVPTELLIALQPADYALAQKWATECNTTVREVIETFLPVWLSAEEGQ